MEALRFRVLLYRYFFYGWLFRDVNRGSMFEQAAAWRHNREQARWLPTYMRRALVVAATALCTACFCELALASPVLSAFFYVPGILGAVYNAVTLVCWGALTSDWGARPH